MERSIEILRNKKPGKLKVGVIGTRSAVESGVYSRNIAFLDSRVKVYMAACPLFVHLVEEGRQKKPETAMIIKKYLHPLKVRQIDALLCGCAHDALLKPIIQRKIGKRVPIIDASETIVEKLTMFLNNTPDFDQKLTKNGTAEFYVSDSTERFAAVAKAILKRDVRLKLLRP